MRTDIIIIDNDGIIELHFEGDVFFPNYCEDKLFELLTRKVDLIAYSSEFKKLENETKNN